MIKKITIEYWATTTQRFDRVKTMFEITVRQDFWESLSDSGKEQFLQGQIWDDMECGYQETSLKEQVAL